MRTSAETRVALAGLGALAVVGATVIHSAPRWVPAPDDASADSRTLVAGLIDDPSSQSPWAIWGQSQTSWNNFIASRALPQLFAYTPETYDWVPSLAADLPSPLTFDGEKALWHSTVPLRRKIDGEHFVSCIATRVI